MPASFRTSTMCGEMRAKGDAGLADLAQFRQRHDLEPAGIGQDRMGPVHEAVQPAQGGDALGIDDRDFFRRHAKTFRDLPGEVDVITDDAFGAVAKAERR